MAAGATLTGIDEARRDVDRLPDVVQSRLQAAAKATADRCRERAFQLCRKDSGITADSIVVLAELEDKQYVVEVGPAPRPGRTAFLPNLPIWIERGTKNQAASPFMRPAREAESSRYIADMKAAALGAVAEVLG